MIDKILLWFLLLFGIALFIFSLRRPPIKDWLLAFFIATYFAALRDAETIQGLMGHFGNNGIRLSRSVLPTVCFYFIRVYSIGTIEENW